MALPATDTFTGTNADPLSGNWTTLVGGFHIWSNHANTTSGNPAAAWWDADVFADDQYAQVDIGTFASAYNGGACVRMSASGGYGVHAQGDEVRYVEFDGTGAIIDSVVLTSGNTFIDGDVIRIEAQGTTIRCYKNGVQQGSDQTDATLTSGSAGILCKDEWVDDFEGGNLAAGGSAFPAHYYQQMRK